MKLYCLVNSYKLINVSYEYLFTFKYVLGNKTKLVKQYPMLIEAKTSLLSV